MAALLAGAGLTLIGYGLGVLHAALYLYRCPCDGRRGGRHNNEGNDQQ